jgi:beta-glucanase (GH16 family)
MRPIHALFAAAFASALASVAAAQCPSDLWNLTFSDEFNGTSVDATTWTYEVGRWPYNNELENYQRSNVTEGNGSLTITAARDPRFNPAYSSGRINTRGRFLQQFGKFEMRAKLPRGKGMWPAFWLLPQDTWPPEIDIMENLGHETSKVYFTNHWGTYPNVQSQPTSYSGPDFSLDFHTYACEWYPDRIDFFVDGVRRTTHRNAGIPAVPMYIILNLAVGGDWPGYPDGTTLFPQKLVVDWVRAYERLQPSQTLTNSSFESFGANNATPLANWTKSGNAYCEPVGVRTGAHSGKLYGNFTGGVNTSSVYQEVSVTPGDIMAGTGWFMNLGSDRMSGSNTASMYIEWRTATNTVVSRSSIVVADASSPADSYMSNYVYGTVPATATKARFGVEFRQPALNNGAIFFDDLVFGKISCPMCIADFNQDGGIDGSDVGAFFDSWEAGNSDADVNQDGGIDGADVASFFVAWESGSC